MVSRNCKIKLSHFLVTYFCFKLNGGEMNLNVLNKLCNLGYLILEVKKCLFSINSPGRFFGFCATAF